MVHNHLQQIEPRATQAESISLTEKVAKLGYWECDLETGQYLGSGFGQKLLDLTGKTRPTVEDMVPVVHPEDRETFLNLHRLQFEGKEFVGEFRILVNGEVRYLQVATQIIFDEQKRPIRSIGIAQEITLQKQDQDARKKYEEQYRSFFQDACYAIWVMHSDGTFVEWNPKALQMYGMENESEIFRHTFVSLAPPEQPDGVSSQEKAQTLIQTALEKGHHEFEWFARRLNGELFWTLVSATKFSSIEKGLLLVILRDIDEEKKARIELQENEARYKCLFENTAFGAWILTPEGVFIDCNSRMMEIAGATKKEQILNLTPADFSPTYQPDGSLSTEKAKRMVQIALEKGQHDFDWLHKRLDGRTIWARISLTKMSVEGKDLIQSIVQDIDQEKKFQIRLAESEASYKALFENSSFATWILDSDGKFTDCNNRALEIVRAESKELLLQKTPQVISALYQPDGKPSAEGLEEVRHIVMEEGHCDFEWLHRRFDGSEFWAYVSLDKICIGGKDFIQAVAQDIDEVKRSQQLLVESEEKYRAFFENAFFAVCILAPGGALIDCNPQTLKLFGTEDKKMLLNKTPVDVSPKYQPDGKTSAEKAEEVFRRTLEEGRCDVEWLHQRFDGKEFLSRAGLTKISIGGKDFIHIIIQDIDEERRAQYLLKESEIRKEFIIKNAGFTVWLWDMKTGWAINTNEDSPLFNHFPKEGIFIEEMIQNIHPEDRETFREKTFGLASGTIDNPELEYRYPNPKGGWTWFKTNGMILERDETGVPTLAIGFHQDITERKRYEQHLLAAQKSLEEANQAKSLFLANMSHEIRTPMTAILGYLDLICDEDVTPTEREEYAQTIRRNGLHLLDLINDILDLSKIEAGQTDLNPSYTQTIELIENVVEPLGSLAHEKGIALTIHYLTKVPRQIWTDPRFLRQILWNIIGNAIKFTNEGRINVIIEYIAAFQGKAKLRRNSILKIRVQDTGCGIPAHQLETIFEPFVQADSTATRQFGGTGLGLAIARRQMEMLKGTIRAWNNSTGGATFEIVHPLKEDEKDIPLIQPDHLPTEKRETKKRKSTAFNLDGIHVLLAEDGMDNQRLISTVLRKAGATVDIANNGQEAIEMVLAASTPNDYDVILMDMQMPLLDGYAATSKIREMKVDTPIIALTAHAMSGDRKKCMESGCDSYCTKPIRPQKLVAIIFHHAQRSSGGRSSAGGRDSSEGHNISAD